MILQNGDRIEIYSEDNSDNLKTTTGGIQLLIEEENGIATTLFLTRKEATELAGLILRKNRNTI